MWVMRSLALLVLCILVFSFFNLATGAEDKVKQPEIRIVEIKPSEGKIRIELWADKAPQTVKNFLRYVEEGFYDGTIFHRVMDNFMIQGGGFTGDMNQKKPHEPIKNEAAGELKNDRGTLAMARTNVVDSATSQFFINLKDNEFLNHRDASPTGFGYAVFGKVVSGLDVLARLSPRNTDDNHEAPPGDMIISTTIEDR